MARQLWVLRHAEAEPHGVRRDSERRLTERGERQARDAGLALAAMGARFDVFLTSPKVRARQTAELAAESWEEEQRTSLRIHDPLASGFEAAQALELAYGAPADGRLLLVGHEPDLTRIIGELTGARAELKKGAVAVLRLEGGGGELLALIRPRELALIALAGDAVAARAVPAGG